MTELLLLDGQKSRIVRIGRDFDGKLFDDLHAVDLQPVHLLGIVGEDAKLSQAEGSDFRREPHSPVYAAFPPKAGTGRSL